MLRYNGKGHSNLFSNDILVEVKPQYSQDAIDSIKGMSDDNLNDAVEKGLIPAYCAPSVTDKTFFNPANSALQNAVAFAPRKALYDSINGKIPELAINPGWLRNPARDRTEIDFALDVIKKTVENAKAKDTEALKALEGKAKDLEDLSAAIKSGVSTDNTVTSSSTGSATE